MVERVGFVTHADLRPRYSYDLRTLVSGLLGNRPVPNKVRGPPGAHSARTKVCTDAGIHPWVAIVGAATLRVL